MGYSNVTLILNGDGTGIYKIGTSTQYDVTYEENGGKYTLTITGSGFENGYFIVSGTSLKVHYEDSYEGYNFDGTLSKQ